MSSRVSFQTMLVYVDFSNRPKQINFPFHTWNLLPSALQEDLGIKTKSPYPCNCTVLLSTDASLLKHLFLCCSKKINYQDNLIPLTVCGLCVHKLQSSHPAMTTVHTGTPKLEPHQFGVPGFPHILHRTVWLISQYINHVQTRALHSTPVKQILVHTPLQNLQILLSQPVFTISAAHLLPTLIPIQDYSVNTSGDNSHNLEHLSMLSKLISFTTPHLTPLL